MLETVESAGLLANTGNTVWWAGREARSETFPAGESGFHTDRESLETLLVGAAETVGVRVYPSASARSAQESERGWSIRCDTPDDGQIELRAPWVLDATGRHGFLARREGREPDRSTTTLALVRRWRSAHWDRGTANHTLVESYENGWAWSVPLDAGVRCVTAMVDQRHAELEGADVAAMFTAELGNTEHLGPTLESATPIGDAWACPASLYSSSRYGRPGLLLVGDAGSFIDPLSSYGVKKALSSGWLAGVVAHTALVDPPLADTAVSFFDHREREVYRSYRRVSADFFEEAEAHYGHAYWRTRAQAARRSGGVGPGGAHDADEILSLSIPETSVRAAFEVIRSRERLGAIRAPSLRAFERPTVLGQRIVLADHLASEACPEGLLYVRGVDLKKLVDIAARTDDVPDGWSAYNEAASPVTLPDYLTALATAFAAGFLVHRDE